MVAIKEENDGNASILLAQDEVHVYKGIPEMPAEMETAQGQVAY